jgi:chromosome partitioning protein
MTSMARVIAVANQKGGVGKTTVATNLVVESVARGKKTLLVDTDPQGSSMMFAAARAETRPVLRTVQIATPKVHVQVQQLAPEYDLVVLDCGGRDSAIFRSALVSATDVIVPVQPSAYDIWASESVFEMLRELESFRPGQRSAILINMALPRTRIAKEAEEALAEYKVPVLSTILMARVAWKHSGGEGLGVSEWEPKGEANRELQRLVEEIGL